MPDRTQHLDRAEENEILARSLDFDKGSEVDWAIVILFYSAVHCIDSVLAGKNKHPKDHKSRDSDVENHGTLNPIYNDYRRLKDGSREARYDIPNYHKTQFPQFEKRFKTYKGTRNFSSVAPIYIIRPGFLLPAPKLCQVNQ